MRDASFSTGRASRRRRASAPPIAERLEERALLSLAATQLLGSSSLVTFGGPERFYQTTAVELDAAGNTVVSGLFAGTVDLDPTRNYPGNIDRLASADNTRDAYVAKFAPDGRVLWARRVGSEFDDNAGGIAIDAAGAVYATGFVTGSLDNPATPAVNEEGRVDFGNGFTLSVRTPAPDGRATTAPFVWKLDGATGATLSAVGAQSLTRTANQGWDIAVTAGGDALISGVLRGATTFGATTLSPGAGWMNFVARLRSDGTFAWAVGTATALNTTSFDRVALDRDGNVLATGNVVDGAGNSNIFVRKLAGDTGATTWSRVVGGPGYDAGTDVTTDPANGDVLVSGRFMSGTDFNGDGKADFPTFPVTESHFFAWRLDGATGNQEWVRDLGGRVLSTSPGGFEIGRPSLALEGNGRVVVAAPFEGRANVATALGGAGGVAFNSQLGPLDSDPARQFASIDTMLVRLDAAAGTVVEARRAGGDGLDVPTGLAARAGQPVVLVGNFANSANAANAANPAASSARFTTAGLALPVVTIGGDSSAQSIYIARFGEAFSGARPATDFDADGRGDLVVYDPMRSDIFLQPSTLGGATNRRIFGPGALFVPGSNGRAPNDVAPQAVTGDFDGDGLADLVVFEPDRSYFWTLYSDLNLTQFPPTNPNQNPNTLTGAQLFFFGPGSRFTGARFHPVPLAGDIDGDGRDDLIVYDPMATIGSHFFVLPSNPGASAVGIRFGPTTPDSAAAVPSIPLAADVNGDGRDDLIVYQPGTSQFSVRLSGATLAQDAGTDQFTFPVGGGVSARTTPVAGDFDGAADNKAELGVYDPLANRVQIRNSTFLYNGAPSSNFVLVPGTTGAALTLGASDLNGDGKDDLVLFNPVNATAPGRPRSTPFLNVASGAIGSLLLGPDNAQANLHAPTNPAAPARSALNPYYRPAATVPPRSARVATLALTTPTAVVVTPTAPAPTAMRRRATAARPLA
jgi:hypothetical protein